MKILIVGGGIGGLAARYAIKKHLPSATVTLYEAHESPASTTSIIGGGLGLAPNGQRVLAQIYPPSMEYIRPRALEHQAFTFRDERGRLLGNKDWGNQKDGYVQMMAARATVHQSLLAGVDDDESVVWGKKVTAIKETKSAVDVTLGDGSTETFDLVIGADGVHSVCRDAIFGAKVYPPSYHGLTGIGGFLPLSSLSDKFQKGIQEHPITMTFSRSGFFGYSLCTPISTPLDAAKIQWWSTFEIDPAPQRNELTPDAARERLLSLHGHWKSPYDPPSGSGIFTEIINKANEVAKSSEGWLVLPTFITAILPNWTSLHKNGSGKIVLLGDAAHVMPPDSGQGVSCAVEDALALALFLKHYATKSDNVETVIKATAKAYEGLRMPRVAKILSYSKKGGDGKRNIGFLGEKMRNFGLWIFCNLIPNSFFDAQFAYDVGVEVDTYIAKNKM